MTRTRALRYRPRAAARPAGSSPSQGRRTSCRSIGHWCTGSGLGRSIDRVADRPWNPPGASCSSSGSKHALPGRARQPPRTWRTEAHVTSPVPPKRATGSPSPSESYALQPQPVHRRNLRTRTCARPGWRRAAARLSNTELARPGQQLLSYFATSRSLSPPIVGERPGPLVAPPRTSVAAHPVPSGFGSKAGSRLGENASFSKAHLRTVRSSGIASSRQMARKVSPIGQAPADFRG